MYLLLLLHYFKAEYMSDNKINLAMIVFSLTKTYIYIFSLSSTMLNIIFMYVIYIRCYL